MSMNSFHARKPKARLTTPEKKPRPAVSHPPGQERVDALLVQRGIAASRSAAQGLIAAGRVVLVLAPGQEEAITKSSQLLPAQANLRVRPAEQETP